MGKLFAVVDCNNFYVSCEKVFDPSLCSKPIIVLSNNDGCVISRSEEAKALGIKMGVPYFQIKALCEKEKVRVFSSNFHFYGDMSARVMNCIADFTPNMEIYSIDEAFLDLTGFQEEDLDAYAAEISSRVSKWTSIPVSVGLASTKTLSKAANLIGKKYVKAPVFNLLSAEAREYGLRLLDVREVWGIGSRLSEKFKSLGINSAWDLAVADDALIKSNFSISELKIAYELRGISCFENSHPQAQKTIATTRSFGGVIKDKYLLEKSVISFVTNAASKLRRQGLLASALYLYVRTNKHSKKDEYLYDSHLVKFQVATDDTSRLIKYTKEALSKIYKNGVSYKKAGVVLMDLIDPSRTQFSLIEGINEKKSKILMKMMDEINAKAGNNKVKFASNSSHIAFSKGLPHFTTRWEDLPKVYCA